MEILDVLFTYGVPINSICTLIAVVLSFIAILQTSRNSKNEQKRFERELEESKKQYENSLRTQRRQYEEQLQRSEEIRRLQELPWFVFKRNNTSMHSDGTIDFVLENKGKGAAYLTQPDTKCSDISINSKQKLTRCEPVQDHVVMVKEQFTTRYRLNDNKNFLGIDIILPIQYMDASGRNYKQEFQIMINRDGTSYVTNWAKPVLLEERTY